MFLVTITYVKPMAEIEAGTAEHRAWLDQYVQQGLIIAAGPQVPRTGGVLLVRGGGTKEALETLLKDDPFQKNGLARHDVIEFAPGKYHPALEAFL